MADEKIHDWPTTGGVDFGDRLAKILLGEEYIYLQSRLFGVIDDLFDSKIKAITGLVDPEKVEQLRCRLKKEIEYYLADIEKAKQYKDAGSLSEARTMLVGDQKHAGIIKHAKKLQSMLSELSPRGWDWLRHVDHGGTVKCMERLFGEDNPSNLSYCIERAGELGKSLADGHWHDFSQEPFVEGIILALHEAGVVTTTTHYVKSAQSDGSTIEMLRFAFSVAGAKRTEDIHKILIPVMKRLKAEGKMT